MRVVKVVPERAPFLQRQAPLHRLTRSADPLDEPASVGRWGKTMKRKLLASLAILVLSATLFTVVDAGVAGAAPIASGSVVCNITGKGTFTPKLTLAGGATALAIAFGGGTTSGCFASATNQLHWHGDTGDDLRRHCDRYWQPGSAQLGQS